MIKTFKNLCICASFDLVMFFSFGFRCLQIRLAQNVNAFLIPFFMLNFARFFAKKDITKVLQTKIL